MKNDLKGYYELVMSQENCINSMKEQNERLIEENQRLRIELRNSETLNIERQRNLEKVVDENEIIMGKRDY